MRYMALSALVLLAACGVTKREVNTPVPYDREVVQLGGYAVNASVRETNAAIELTNYSSISNHGIRADSARVWSEMPAVYTALGIEGAGVLNDADRIFGTNTQRIFRRLGDQRLTKYIDCGSSYAGDADTYEVLMSVRTEVRAAPGGFSTVRSWITATGRQAGSSSTPRDCQTTNVLERQIARMLTERVANSAS